jgi:hypothetical protein
MKRNIRELCSKTQNNSSSTNEIQKRLFFQFQAEISWLDSEKSLKSPGSKHPQVMLKLELALCFPIEARSFHLSEKQKVKL